MAPIKYVSCPFYPVHRIEELALAKHIHKCLKSWKLANPHKKVTQCTLDATHFIFDETLDQHLLTCSSREIIDRSMFYDHTHAPSVEQEQNEANNQPDGTLTDEECWDVDETKGSAPQSSFNPGLSALDKPIYRRPPVHLGKSGKKKWRIAEEQRVRNLKNNETIENVAFPEADGQFKTIGELRIEMHKGCTNYGLDLNRLQNFPVMTLQEKMTKCLMRVDGDDSTNYTPPTFKPKPSRVAANIFASIPSANQDKRNSVNEIL